MTKPSFTNSWAKFLIEGGIIFIIIFLFLIYGFRPAQISGPSMCQTFNFVTILEDGKNKNVCLGQDPSTNKKGEIIIANKFIYKWRAPQRGEVIVFQIPGKEAFIKRVIGVPGDTIEIKKGQLYLSNKQVTNQLLSEPYLSEMNKKASHVLHTFQRNNSNEILNKFIVPSKQYLVLGDNRYYSSDSRQYFNIPERTTPFLKKEEIIGRADFVVFPFFRMRKIDNTPYYKD